MTSRARAPESDAVRASHRDLSRVDQAFRRFASENPECLRRSAFDVPHPLRSLIAYDMQPWPVFVDRRKLAELAAAGRGISRLIRSLPQRIFDGDPARISEFYGLDDPAFVAGLLAPPDGIAEAISRADFAAHASGLKCLEFNCAGNLGGWESELMLDILSRVPVIARFLEEQALEVSVTNSLRVMLTCALRQMRSAGIAAGEQVNMALDATADAYLLQHPMAARLFAREYGAALRDALPGTSGEFFLTDGSHYELRRDRLHHRGRRVHGLITAQSTGARDLIFRAFKEGHLQIYNGPIAWLLNDKRNLALLSEHAESELFDAHEKKVIRDHVPWTRCVTGGHVRFRGEDGELPELLVSHRRRLVLKKAQSSSGRDVILGRDTDPEPWSRAVERALAGGGWIAQELVESRPYLFQEGSEGCSPHHLIWGIFVFGDIYGGATVRVLPKTLEGIVSAARGATKSLLLELGE